MSWMDDVIAIEAYEDGVEISPNRRKINFIGASVEPDPATNSTIIRIGSTSDWKGSVRVATTGDLGATRTGNILTHSSNGSINTPGIDGVSNLSLNQLVLVKNETTLADNGLYKITDLGSPSSKWVMERADLADSSKEVTCGLTTYVEEGTINSRTMWRLKTPNPIVLNVSSLVFESLPVTPHANAVGPAGYVGNTAQRVILADSTGGSFTVLLPYADEWVGGMMWVKDIGGVAGANNIHIEHDGGTIEGGATLVININRRCYTLYSDGGADLRILSIS